ncbi:hypothetical protein ACTZM3_27650, partial [Klebsiella pneumoniae]
HFNCLLIPVIFWICGYVIIAQYSPFSSRSDLITMQMNIFNAAIHEDESFSSIQFKKSHSLNLE